MGHRMGVKRSVLGKKKSKGGVEVGLGRASAFSEVQNERNWPIQGGRLWARALGRGFHGKGRLTPTGNPREALPQR